MPPVLDKSRPLLSVLDLERDAFIAKLSDLLKAKDVQSAYVVGSYARQQAEAWSDIDLLIVYETEMPFVERPRIFDELRDFGVPFDILVYTPNEFASLEQDPTGFWRSTKQDRLRIV